MYIRTQRALAVGVSEDIFNIGVYMEVLDYEKCIISVILRNPVGKEQIPYRICSELDADKFSITEHKTIYNAIQTLIQKKEVPSLVNVFRQLGSKLDSVGGEEYLTSVYNFLDVVKSGWEGFESWVRLIDNAGRLRHLGLVIDKYSNEYKNFEELVAKTTDVDEFLSNFLSVINTGVGKVKSNYHHIKDAVTEEKSRLASEQQGYVVDIIPCGVPSIEKYFIPRPATYGVISGLSSMGKTQFAIMLMLGVAIQLKHNNLPGCVAINELETRAWRLNRRMACSLAGVDSNELSTGKVTGKKLEMYYDILDYISELPIFYDDNPNITSTQLGWQAMALHLEKGPRILGVSDYLELFTDENNNEELRISNIVRNTRRICWETNSNEIAISQLNNSVLQTNTKIGGIGKARYSGAIGQAADWFIEVYNPVQMRKSNIDFVLPDNIPNEDHAYALIEKNRDHSLGVEPFEWIPEYTRFKDLSLPMGFVYRK